MKPVDQTIFGVPGGNCFAACVASVLELPLEEVPNFCDNMNPAWFGDFCAWLRPRGFYALSFKLDGKPGGSEGWYPEGLHIAGGPSPRHEGVLHAVVARGSEVVHDPHPSRASIPSFVDTILIVPLDVVRS